MQERKLGEYKHYFFFFVKRIQALLKGEGSSPCDPGSKRQKDPLYFKANREEPVLYFLRILWSFPFKCK
jgi:hypothetical protein